MLSPVAAGIASVSWPGMGLRPEFCQLVGKSAEAVAALRQADAELHTALIDIERVLPIFLKAHTRPTAEDRAKALELLPVDR